MAAASDAFLARVNLTRYQGQPQGHYESFFQRANHPARPLAFWIRYTLFSPRGQPEAARGELWAIYFDGESGRHRALKQNFPLNECHFSADAFEVRLGGARLDGHGLQGAIAAGAQAIAWDLTYDGSDQPLLLLPPSLYRGKFPAAKSLVGRPLARFRGRLTVNGTTVAVDDWPGSQNHNWGARHTDRYAWGQVAGFDDHPDSFLEVVTAQLRLGPVWSPPFTPLVLRHQGREYQATGLWRAVRARGAFDYFDWQFRTRTAEAEIEGRITAPREAFLGLRYDNPPGGAKQCLNTKIARCTLQLTDRRRGVTETLASANRAAFEILTDDTRHGVPIAA